MSIANQKGGVGKTTTAVNLGAALAAMGQRVCLIDLDSQRNLSHTVEVDGHGNRSIADLIYNHVSGIDYDPEQWLLHNEREHLDYVQASTMLATAPSILATSDNSSLVLSEILHSPVFAGYDYILIDCRPALDLLAVNALAASDAVVIPVEPESYAVDGLADLFASIERTRKTVNPQLRVNGILVTRADSRRKLTHQMITDLREVFGTQVYNTVIPYLADAAKAASEQHSAVTINGSRLGNAYLELAKEVVAR
ncbi:AAA family ATPase [Oscillibacter sp.]|uniref:ParA family protein n=1 Tax=Oscillibacter sp. TaxID=1945593 RepID=UPI0033992646